MDSEKALQIDPGVSANQYSYGQVLMAQGQLDKALLIYDKAINMDPLSVDVMSSIGRIYDAQGEYEKAQEIYIRALQISPNHFFIRHGLAVSYLLQGDVGRSLKIFQQNDDFWNKYGTALAEYSFGNIKAADAALQSIIQDDAHNAAYQVATIYAWRGESEAALLWLERSYEQKDGGLSMIKFDPLLNSLRKDQSFTSLIAKMGLQL